MTQALYAYMNNKIKKKKKKTKIDGAIKVFHDKQKLKQYMNNI
jgi:hypothetical protein